MKGVYVLFAILLFNSCSTTQNSEVASKDSRVDTLEEKQVSDRIIKLKPVAEDPYRKLAGMDIGEEKIYYATDARTNYDYQLAVKKISSDSLKFRLTATDQNGVIKSIFGKLAKRDKDRQEIQHRFGISLPVLVYTLSSKETSTELVIDKKRADFVRFDYFVNSNGASTWNETDPLKVGVKNLLLQVSNPYQDYEAYFHKMIERTRKSYSQIVGRDSTSRNYESNLNFYQSYLANTSKLLDEYLKANTEYVLSNDSSLLNKIVYYQLDAVQRLMESKGVEFNIRILPEGKQTIPIDFQNHLVVDLLHDRQKGLNTEKIYKMEYSKGLGYEDLKFEIGLLKFYTDREDFVQYNDSLYLGILNGFGFETVNHLLTLWKPQGDSLVLKEILNKVISVGIGEVEVDTLIVTPDHNIVIIGNKMGGDEGYVWGGFWIGSRSVTGELNMVLERNFEGRHDRHEKINHRLLNDSIIELETVIHKWENGKMIDSVENTELINIIKLANGSLVIPVDLTCNSKVITETYDSLYELDTLSIDRFLGIIAKKCREYEGRNSIINELLMRIFEKHPIKVASLLANPQKFEFDIILNHIRKPTSELRVNIKGIINKIEDANFQNPNIDKVLEALNQGLEYYQTTKPKSNN